ncbi:MAG: transporter suffix domain-containing protein [Betaproteobacteria bacterium]|nr:MAG: transporter suffix domain-containing protein [Betaproteobacteria bacterium]
MTDKQIQVGWRIKLGFALFIASISWPILLPVMPVLGFSGTAIASFSGAMLVAAEIMIIAGAAIAGKDGFAFIKQKVFGFLKSYGPPQEVSRARYIFGLIVFCIPVGLGWAWPYVGDYLPSLQVNLLVYAIAGDVMLLISLFILGGAFWDKLRSLFIHSAYVVVPEK